MSEDPRRELIAQALAATKRPDDTKWWLTCADAVLAVLADTGDEATQLREALKRAGGELRAAKGHSGASLNALDIIDAALAAPVPQEDPQ